MSKRRAPTSSPRMNFRTAESSPSELRGTKPTAQQTSVGEILTLMVLHVCKKSIFFDTRLKVGIYLAALFLVSLIADIATIPKNYLARSDNLFNVYFVKFAWGWNLLLIVPFVSLTAYVYCCGEKPNIFKQHLSRIGIATFFWFFWTKIFNIIETNFGRCNVRGEAFSTKATCLQFGHFWNGFDLSGHAFILIYGSLMLIEETRSIVNWESIKDLIRNEDHYRQTKDTSIVNSPLRFLSDIQFHRLKISYDKFTPYIRGLFIVITLMQILWDVMLISTILYYHIMIEKFLGGVFAILTWFFTYRFWYKLPTYLPRVPGDGMFKYIKDKPTTAAPPTNKRRTGSIINGNQVPKFMGMPLYGLRTENVTDKKEEPTPSSSTSSSR